MPTPQNATDVAVPTLWLTRTEAAAYAKVSVSLIQRAVRAGEIQAFPIGKGKEYRLRATDIDAWLMSKAWEPGA